MKFVTWIVVAPLLLLLRFGESSSQQQDEDTYDPSDVIHYPRVYTAWVPSPNNNDNRDMNKFVAQVDLISIDECGDENCRISFLVHGDNELHYLRSFLSTLQPNNNNNKNTIRGSSRNNNNGLVFDPYMTSTFHEQANNNSDESSSSIQRVGGEPRVYSTIPGFSCYRNLNGMQEFMRDLEDRSNDDLTIELQDIGDSYIKTTDNNDGYDILALKITGNNNAISNKAVLMAMSGIHAREFSPPELLARWAEFLVDSYDVDPDIASLLDSTEIHLILQANPDGRAEVEVDRNTFRRKNKNPTNGSCGGNSYGVDLNRNFPFRWGRNDGSSDNACQETYRGPSPASEPETKAIVEYARKIFPSQQRKDDPENADFDNMYDEETTIGMFLDVHSFGEIMIWPWGHVNTRSSNNDGLETIMNKLRHFNGYDLSGPQNGFSYPASGAADDWAYGTLGAAGMTLELGNAFFQSCFYFQNDIVQKNIEALNYAAKISAAPYFISKGPDVINIAMAASSVANNQGAVVKIVAAVSDSAYSNFQQTNTQSITAVQIHVNNHPLNNNNDSPSLMTLTSSGTTVRAEFDLDVNSLGVGRHTIYIRGVDSNGYAGPVSAKWLNVTPGNGNNSSNGNGNGNGNGNNNGNGNGNCSDNVNESFIIPKLGITTDCDWVFRNMGRMEHLCRLVEIAHKCPKTCNTCALFA